MKVREITEKSIEIVPESELENQLLGKWAGIKNPKVILTPSYMSEGGMRYDGLKYRRQMTFVIHDYQKGMPEHFRWKIDCKECEAGGEADGHYGMSAMDAWLSEHIKAFGHTKYDLEIVL